MDRTNLFRRIAGFSLLSALCMSLIGFSSNSAKAQNAQYSANSPTVRSRAEQEAEQEVALSSDKIIDLLRQPQLARGDQIIAIPTLMRKLPEPMKKIIGDLSNTHRTLVELDLRPTS